MRLAKWLVLKPPCWPAAWRPRGACAEAAGCAHDACNDRAAQCACSGGGCKGTAAAPRHRRAETRPKGVPSPPSSTRPILQTTSQVTHKHGQVLQHAAGGCARRPRGDGACRRQGPAGADRPCWKGHLLSASRRRSCHCVDATHPLCRREAWWRPRPRRPRRCPPRCWGRPAPVRRHRHRHGRCSLRAHRRPVSN